MTGTPHPAAILAHTRRHPRGVRQAQTPDDAPEKGRHEMTATADAAVEGSCLGPACPFSWAPRWLREVVDP